jgi:hypothetical protein
MRRGSTSQPDLCFAQRLVRVEELNRRGEAEKN